MKQIKICIAKNKTFSDQYLGLFKLVNVNPFSHEILGNKIRRTLLQDLV